MKKATLSLFTLTVVGCLCVFYIEAQSVKPSNFRGTSSPQSTPYNPITPSPNKKNKGNNPVSINLPEIQRNQQEQLQKANQELLRQKHSALIKEELRQADMEYFRRENLKKLQLYQQAYARLMAMNNDDFSISKAVYLVENAYYENQFTYEQFLRKIQEKAAVCREIMKTEKLDTNDNLAKNYAIQKLYSGGVNLYNARTKTWQPVKPFRYDFEDYRGEQDWKKMLVTKLLQTGSGQCHTLPLSYNLIANELHATAWLSTSPEHCYVKFPDNKGNIYNFETTQGKIISDQAIVMCGYISPAAIKNRIYMDTLSKKRLLAQMLVDLLHGYREKFQRYDEFTDRVLNKILILDSLNITALLMKNDTKVFSFEYAANKKGRPPINKLPEYPDLYRQFLELQNLNKKISGLGYQPMPKEAYEGWLLSMKQKKREQESNELQERIKRLLRQPKPTLVNKRD